jgi:hypothetical protein
MSITINHQTDSLLASTKLTANLTARAVNASATSGTLTINTDVTDLYIAQGLTGAITLTTSGTPTNGQKLLIRLEDNGTARSISWTTGSTGFRAIGVTLPTTTTAAKITYVGAVYNSTSPTYPPSWDVVAVVTQA